MITPRVFRPIHRFLAAGTLLLLLVNALHALTAPTLLSPAHNEVGYVEQPNFSWAPVVDAFAYEIQVAAIHDFSASIVASGTVEIPRFVPLAPLAQFNRFWRVRALDGSGTPGPWSSTFVYKLQAPANSYTIAANAT